MQQFTFELLFEINGIGSASGLVHKNNSLYIISDSSSFLYEFEFASKEIQKIKLIENPAESIIKKGKPDFEAITELGDNVYIFGSGSTENRNKLVQINSESKAIIATIDLANLYQKLQDFAKIDSTDFNIEGAILTDEKLYLFNRGNGLNKANIIFTITGNWQNDNYEIASINYELPEINRILTSFTDAILVDDKIYFLATAEDSNSTYNDGEVMGSLIGRIDIQTMKIDFTQQITNSKKLEGLTLYKKSTETIDFLLCEDNDSDELKSNIYRLVLNQ